jgi:hypothetical protein
MHYEGFIEQIAAAGGNELLRAVEDEFRMGWQAQTALVLAQQQRMAEACTRLESAAVDGLGHIDGDIPADSWFYWNHREPGCWKDSKFRKEYFRDNPQFKVRYRSAKPRVGYTAPVNPAPPGTLFRATKYTPAREVTAA